MKDYIERQAAFDVVRTYDFNFPQYMERFVIELRDAMKKDLEEDIKQMPSAQQWIPCSERLPEEEGWYLVTIQNDKTRKRRTENDLFAIGIAEAHKKTPYKFCKDGHRQTVIAWMPIPEPYKT